MLGSPVIEGVKQLQAGRAHMNYFLPSRPVLYPSSDHIYISKDEQRLPSIPGASHSERVLAKETVPRAGTRPVVQPE